MAASSITKNFVVSGQRQVEKFANAIEESYQESLHRAPTPDLRITHLHGSEEVKKFMAKRNTTKGSWCRILMTGGLYMLPVLLLIP